MFQKAARLRLRFDSPAGALSVEDLWQLHLTSATGKANLDDIARNLFIQLKSDNAVSFVNPTEGSDPVMQLRFDIVKHIIDVRVAEAKAASEVKANKERKQDLLAILAEKQNADLKALPVDELRRMIEAL